jgi:hypothetical protein
MSEVGSNLTEYDKMIDNFYDLDFSELFNSNDLEKRMNIQQLQQEYEMKYEEVYTHMEDKLYEIKKELYNYGFDDYELVDMLEHYIKGVKIANDVK